MASHGAIVTQISQEMNSRYMLLQKQHHEFTAHLNGQIAALEHQLMMQSLYLTPVCCVCLYEYIPECVCELNVIMTLLSEIY